jgi:HNH endonuclease
MPEEQAKKVSALPARLRTQVIESDARAAEDAGAPFACPHCSFEFSLGLKDPNIEVDHKTPVSAGGTNDLENLQSTCRSCNRSKNCYAEADPNRMGVARKVICACGKPFYLSDSSYANCLMLIKEKLLPCLECRTAISPQPQPAPKRKRSLPGAGLPEGFEPAKSTFKKEGIE